MIASCDCPENNMDQGMSHELKTISPLLLLSSSLFCRSFDVYGFCHSQHDSLQGDEDLLRIRVRKNELQAHRVQDVGLHVFLKIALQCVGIAHIAVGHPCMSISIHFTGI